MGLSRVRALRSGQNLAGRVNVLDPRAEGQIILSYNGELIAGKLEVMSGRRAQAFATACAQLLTRFFTDGIPHEAIDQGALRAIVDALWNSNELKEGYAGDSDRDSERLTSVLSGDYAEELGIGEHAISGIYYAIEELRSDDNGMAELVARNLYEAADYYLVARPGFDIASETAEREVLESPLMQQALTFISQALLIAQDIPTHATSASIRNYAENFTLIFE